MEEATRVTRESYCVENAQSQMRKGFLEFSVLLIIGAKPTYAPDILKQLKKANLLVVEGTLYPLLSRLKSQGVVDFAWEESKNSPPKKVYHVTDTGRLAISSLEASWRSFDTIINTFITQYEKGN